MPGKGLIMAVEDTTDSLGLLANTLVAEGYEVLPADSGELALAALAHNLPELILLDIRMPGMDGFEVCRRLKSEPRTREIPVLFLSALSEAQERVQGLKLGAVDFISKPFRKEELLARVSIHLELARLRADLEKRVAERTAELNQTSEHLRLELDEHKRTLQALSESEERFRRLADTVPAIIWMSDENDTLIFLNQYALSLTGRTMAELIGRDSLQVVHPDDQRLLSDSCDESRASGRSVQREIRLQRADGEYLWMLSTVVARGNESGGFIGMMADITELRQNRERMVANQKLESLAMLAQGVAHDVNNLLGTILSEADLAQSDLPPDSPAQESLERIKSAAFRDSEIVALLNAYAGTGKEAPAELVDLSALVEDTLRLLHVSVSRKTLIQTHLAPNLPALWMNPTQVRQTVMNLAINALESLGDRGGTITFTTSHQPARTGFSPHGACVRLEVADNGCGMSDEVQSRIFDPFYSTKSIGRGLGLAAVQGILRSVGGIITVRSTLGQGSTFELDFPCAQPQHVGSSESFAEAV